MTLEITVVQYKAESVRCLSFRRTIITIMLRRLLLQRMQCNQERYLPSHIILGVEFGLKKPSMVLLEQIRTVNREDLREYIGTVDDDKLFRQINETLKKSFGLLDLYKPEGKRKYSLLVEVPE